MKFVVWFLFPRQNVILGARQPSGDTASKVQEKMLQGQLTEANSYVSNPSLQQHGVIIGRNSTIKAIKELFEAVGRAENHKLHLMVLLVTLVARWINIL